MKSSHKPCSKYIIKIELFYKVVLDNCLRIRKLGEFNIKIEIKEIEEGFSIVRSENGGADGQPVANKHELVFVVMQMIFKFLSTENVAKE